MYRDLGMVILFFSTGDYVLRKDTQNVVITVS